VVVVVVVIVVVVVVVIVIENENDHDHDHDYEDDKLAISALASAHRADLTKLLLGLRNERRPLVVLE
jgi:hypothetical protein